MLIFPENRWKDLNSQRTVSLCSLLSQTQAGLVNIHALPDAGKCRTTPRARCSWGFLRALWLGELNSPSPADQLLMAGHRIWPLSMVVSCGPVSGSMLGAHGQPPLRTSSHSTRLPRCPLRQQQWVLKYTAGTHSCHDTPQ